MSYGQYQQGAIDHQLREEKLQIPRYVGYALIPIGIINIVLGIVIFVFLETFKYPLSSGYQFWSGILSIAIGVLGIRLASTSENMKQDLSQDFRKKFFGFFWACNTVNWVATQGFGYSIAGTVMCAVNGCSSDRNDLLIAFHGITIALMIGICVGGWMGQYYFYKFRKAYGVFYDLEIQQMTANNMMQKS